MNLGPVQLSQARVHFIGIGGIGMCGLAELLHNMGAQVTGSDLSENPQTLRLKDLGIIVHQGHGADHLGDADVVVFSSAVKESNPEYRAARQRHIPLIRRAEALAEIMRLKRGIAIGGTHGKTTTTSLTASIFLAAEMQPTIVVGGRLDLIKSTALLGQGEWLIAEADESDGSFSRLAPEIVVITNIDNDHLDHFGNFANLQAAFLDFASRIPFYGSAIVCGDDTKVRELFAAFPKRCLFYGFDPANQVQIVAKSDRWQLREDGATLGEFSVPLPGRHNASNAAAAILVAREAGIPVTTAAAAVSDFKGVDRRSQHKAAVRGIDFFDDYGHHPTEVAAVLSGFRQRFPERRLVVLFQPHRYSRTQLCWDQFVTCFGDADRLFLLDIYPAGETPIPGIDSESFFRALDHSQKTFLKRDLDPELSAIRDELRPGDVFLTLGAGDVYKLGEKLMEKMAKS